MEDTWRASSSSSESQAHEIKMHLDECYNISEYRSFTSDDEVVAIMIEFINGDIGIIAPGVKVQFEDYEVELLNQETQDPICVDFN